MTDELAPLTSGELDQLAQCEATIERGLQTFYEVGSALMTIKEAALYRQDYPSFDAYCQDRWGMGRNYAYKLIAGTQVVNSLQDGVYPGTQLPVNERQTRALKRVPEQQRADVWRVVMERHGANASVKQIEAVIAKLIPSPAPAAADSRQRTRERYGISVSPEQHTDAGMDQDTIDQLASHAIEYHGSVSRDGGATWLHHLVDDDGNKGEYTDRQVKAWLQRLWADAMPPPRTTPDYSNTLPETPPPFLQPAPAQPGQRIERALDEDTIDRLDACGVAYINSMSEDDGRTWAHQVIDADANPRIFTAMGLMAWLEDLERGMVLLPAQDLLLGKDQADTAPQPVEQPAAQATGPAALQMQIAALEGERDQYKEQAEKHFQETERLWSEIAKIDTELRDVRRERDAARADLDAERQRADGLENEADTLSDERNEALDERDALRQQLAQVRASQPAWVPETPDAALDADGLLVELLRQVGDTPVSLLSLVKRLTTTREMLSHSLARCSHLWERLGLLLGDATPGTGGRGLWVPMGDGSGYTFGTIKREERDAVPISLVDTSHSNDTGHGGRPPDTDLRDRVRSLLAEHPDWTQQQIADAAGCGISLVKAVRAGRK